MKISDLEIRWSLKVEDRHGTYLLEHEHGRTDVCKLDPHGMGPDDPCWEVLRRVPPRFKKLISRMNMKP